MKRLWLLLLAGLLCLAAGCANFLDTEYQSQTPHELREEPVQDSQPDTEVSIPAGGDLEALTQAVENLVRARSEYGVIRAAAYDGDLDADAETACLTVAYGTPYGAYAVHNVNFSVNKYVSFSEVRVHLSYNEGAAQYGVIDHVEGPDGARAYIEAALQEYATHVVLYVQSPLVTPQYIQAAVEGIYFAGAEWLPVLPELTVAAYPEEAEGEHILDIALSYGYSTYRMNTMAAKTREAVRELAESLAGLDEEAALRRLAEYLQESCQTLADGEDYDRRSDRYTAYGALALGRAAGEGYAMAVKLVCNALDIDCIVVQGRHNNVAHAWNIVRAGGAYYHLDVSAMAEVGSVGAFMLSDERFAESYFWDAEKYPACTVDRLAGLFAPATPTQTAESTPDDSPAPTEGDGDPQEGDGGEDPQEGDAPQEGDIPGDGETDPPADPGGEGEG